MSLCSRRSSFAFCAFLLLICTLVRIRPGNALSCDDYAHVTSYIGQRYAHQISRANVDEDENAVIDKNIYTCTQTQCHSTVAPWWRLDMRTIVNVSKITIYPKMNDIKNLNNFDVLVAMNSPTVRWQDGHMMVDFSNYKLCNTVTQPMNPNDFSMTIACKPNAIPGRFIGIRKHLDPTANCTYLSMCEIDIWKSDQLVVSVVPSERQLIAGRPVTFSCLTEPLDCKNFYYFWSYGRQWLPFSMKILRFTVSKEMSGSSLYCFVKNRENIELGHDSFALDVINYPPKYSSKNPKCRWKKRVVGYGKKAVLMCLVEDANPPVKIKFKYNSAYIPYATVKQYYKKFKMKIVSGQRVIGVFVIKRTSRIMNNQTISLIVSHPLVEDHEVKIKTPTISFPPDKLNTTMDYKITDTTSSFICYVGESDPKPNVTWKLIRPLNALEISFERKATPVVYRKVGFGHSASTSYFLGAAGLQVNGYIVQCVIEQAALKQPWVLNHTIRIKSAPDLSNVHFSTNVTDYGEDEQLLFTCDIPDCYPPPKVRWLAPNKLIRTSRNFRPERIIVEGRYIYRAQLHVRKVSRTWNRRSVICEITQGMLSDVFRSDPIIINVQFPPLREDIELQMPEKLIENKVGFFVCEIPEAAPVANVKWEIVKNDSTLLDVEGTVINKEMEGKFGGKTLRSEFTISSISRTLFELTLQCVVQHPRLSEVITVAEVLNITYAPDQDEISIDAVPKYLVSGDSAKFFCISPISNPLAVLDWVVPPGTLSRSMRPLPETISTIGEKQYIVNAFELPKLRSHWSQTVLKCTISHELLPMSMITLEKVLLISFPPERYRMQFNKPLEVNENTPASFLCSSPESQPPANITWELKIRGQGLANLSDPIVEISTTKSPGNFGSFTAAGSLFVSSIPRTWNKATISCIIYHPLMKNPWVKRHRLTVRYVFAPSEVILTEDKNGIVENTTAIFKCHVPDAFPPPSMEWRLSKTLQSYKNDSTAKFVKDKTVHTLTFHGLSRDMNGEIVTCVVRLGAWKQPTSKSVRLAITFPPYDPRPTLQGSPVFAAGQTAQFTCTGSSAQPPVQLTWEFRNPEGQRDSAGGPFKILDDVQEGLYRSNISISHLTFPTIPSSMNEFIVICRLQHSLIEQSFTQEMKVFVRFPPNPERFTLVQTPEFVQPGQAVNFVCNIPEAAPRANISWDFPKSWNRSASIEEESRPGIHKGASSTGFLRLQNTDLEWHEKQVSCLMFYNSSIPMKRVTSLNMKFKPLDADPVIVAPSPVDEGDDANFRCIAPEAKPMASIVWEIFDIDGKPVNFRGTQQWISKIRKEKGKFGGIIADSTLTFLATKSQMDGYQVTCRVDHELLKRSLVSEMVPLTVRYSFSSDQVRFTYPKSIAEQDNVTFSCGVPPAQPPANVTWNLPPSLEKLVIAKSTKILWSISNHVLRMGPMHRRLHNEIVICQVSHMLWNYTIERNASIEMTFPPEASTPLLNSGGEFEVGEDAKYWCTGAEALPVGKIEWDLLDRDDNPVPFKEDSKISIKTSAGKFGGLVPTSYLTLFSMTPSMNGLRVVCRFKHPGLAKPQTATTRIYVKFGPDAGQLALLQKPVFAVPDGELSFECYVPEASPKANVSWILPDELQTFASFNETVRQGKMFGEAVTGVLYLRSAQVSWNERNITCVAYHDNGPTIRKSAQLKMNFGPLGLGPTVTPPGPVTEGSDIQFGCLASEALPRADIVWQVFDRDGMQLPLDPSSKVLVRNKEGKYGGFLRETKIIFTGVSASMNGFNVNCRVDHDLKDSVTSKNMELLVRFAPRVKSVILKQDPPMAVVNEYARFVCIAPEASPQAEIKWMFPDKVKPQTNIKTSARNGTRNGFIVVSELTIQHVLSAWNGIKITCIATYGSRANTFEHTVHMKLRYTPLSFRPTMTGPKGIQQPGVDVDYLCTTPEANPPVSITWILADLNNMRQPLPPNARQAVQRLPGKKGGFITNSRLTLPDIQSNYSGFSITCEARQTPEGKAFLRKVIINLQRGPDPQYFTLEQHPKYGRPGGNVEFVCNVPYSTPRATVRWTYPSELIPRANITTKVRSETRYGEAMISRLLLTKVQPHWRDKTFRCVIHHNLTGESERSIRLTLTDFKALLRIETEPSTGTVPEGSVITSTCWVTSCVPDCTIVWVAKLASKPERILKEDVLRSGRREEVFSQIRMTMKPAFKGATIQCRLKGTNTSLETKPFKLSVSSKNLTLSQTVVEVKENNSVNVICKNDEAYPPAEIRWDSLNKTELNFTTKTKELSRPYKAYQTISEVNLKVNRHDNGAILNCVAKNPDSSILVKSVIIRVLYPPEVIIEPSLQYPPEGSNNFSLECISRSGNPQDYYFKWTSSQGGVLLQNKTTLPFPQLMRNQSAIYKCIVSTIKDFEVSRDYEVQVAYMDVNMDRVIQLRTGDSNANFILNITAFPPPESFEWWSDGHRPISLKHRVLSSTRHFHQVALQLNAVNHSLDGNYNHSLRIKHRVGHRFIKVVVRDGSWEDDSEVDSAGRGIPWLIIAVAAALFAFLVIVSIVVVVWRKKTRFRKKLIINGGMDYTGRGVTDMFTEVQDAKGVKVVRETPYSSTETPI